MLVAASIAHLQGEKLSFQVVPTCPCQQLFSLESLLVTVRLSLVLVFGRHIALNHFQCGRNFRLKAVNSLCIALKLTAGYLSTF